MFCVEEYGRQPGWYFVTHSNDDYGDVDEDIVEMLEIELDEYIDMIKKYHVILHDISLREIGEKEDLQYFFTKKEDAEGFVSFLNDNYMVMLKLRGE